MSINHLINTALEGYKSDQIFVLADKCLAVELPYPTLHVEATEQNKSLATLALIWSHLTTHGATRKAVLVNIGGGIICDLGGFAAATYMRGIDYINVPTTLLAMVDAADGGKTAINFDGLKNRVGAFHLPKQVIIEPAFLETLPKEEILSGYAEMLKTALLNNKQHFASTLTSIDNLAYVKHMLSISYASSQRVDLLRLIDACRTYKQSIVRQDPEEANLRKVLNFGHTVGHAIEQKASGQRHGYCVLWGMIAELYLSVAVLGCPKAPLQQLVRVMLDYYGRPSCNCKEQNELLTLMHQDKKNDTLSAINFTLLQDIGTPQINQLVPDSLIAESLDYLFSI